ncbi:MAG: hypothetical protein VCE74_04605 [Alphaproteobacteria bacterium]|jgi:hypothetical protein
MRRISFKSGGVRNHRKDRRLSLLQLTVTADGRDYDSLDWGLGGVRIHGLVPDRSVDGDLLIKVSGVRKEQELSFEVMATIVRMDKEANETALRFDDPTAEDLDTLEALITGRRISA